MSQRTTSSVRPHQRAMFLDFRAAGPGLQLVPSKSLQANVHSPPCPQLAWPTQLGVICNGEGWTLMTKHKGLRSGWFFLHSSVKTYVSLGKYLKISISSENTSQKYFLKIFTLQKLFSFKFLFTMVWVALSCSFQTQLELLRKIKAHETPLNMINHVT